MSSEKDVRATGVYMIRHIASGKVYVGSASTSFKRRWREHTWQLGRNEHSNKYLQAAWNKYGADAFEFRILKIVPPDEVLEHEQAMIDFHKSADRKFGYNCAPIAGNLRGYKQSRESIEKRAAKRRGCKATLEHRLAISAANMGHAVSDETRAKISAAAKRRTMSPETRAKMSAAHKLQSEESRAKIAASMRARRGRHHTPESKAKIAESNRRRGVSSETRRKMSESKKALYERKRAESLTKETT